MFDENLEEFTLRKKKSVVLFYNFIDFACNNARILLKKNSTISTKKFLKSLSFLSEKTYEIFETYLKFKLNVRTATGQVKFIALEKSI